MSQRVVGEPEAPAEGVDVKAAIDELHTQRAALQSQAASTKEQGVSQRVVGEAEARLMRTANHGHQVADNAQIAVDAKQLIAAFALTNESNDQRLLYPMAEQGKAALEAERITVVADTGYCNGEHGERCEAAQITAIVPRAATVNPKASSISAATASPTMPTATAINARPARRLALAKW